MTVSINHCSSNIPFECTVPFYIHPTGSKKFGSHNLLVPPALVLSGGCSVYPADHLTVWGKKARQRPLNYLVVGVADQYANKAVQF